MKYEVRFEALLLSHLKCSIEAYSKEELTSKINSILLEDKVEQLTLEKIDYDSESELLLLSVKSEDGAMPETEIDEINLGKNRVV